MNMGTITHPDLPLIELIIVSFGNKSRRTDIINEIASLCSQ